MRYGVCAEPDKLPAIAQAGADYIECTVTGLNALSAEQLDECLALLNSSKIQCEALAILFPGTIPLVGGEANNAVIADYLHRTFQRISLVGPEIVVFGSGRARMCPENFNREKALEQLVAVGRATADEAAPHHITIAFEPLNRRETNMIHSLAEAHEVVARVNRPNFKMVADLYHMLEENEPASALATYGDEIAHVHVAAKATRACPAPADKPQFEDYFCALKEIGYQKRISIEGRIDDHATQLPEAFALFRSLMA